MTTERRTSRIRRVGSEVAWVGLGQAFAALGSVVGVRYVTELLPPATYGEFALGLTAATIAHQIFLGPLAGSSLRFLTAALDGQDFGSFWLALRRLLREASGLVLVLGVLAAVVLAALSKSASWTLLALTAVGFAIFYGASSVLDGIQNGARQRRIVAWHDGASPWLRFGFAIALVRALGPSARAAMAGYALAALLVLGSQSWFFSRLLRSLRNPDPPDPGKAAGWRRQILEYGGPFAAWGVFSGLQFVSDRWALQFFSDARSVGLYTAVFQLGFYPMSLLSGLLAQSITPVVFARTGDGTSPERIESGDRLIRYVLTGVLVATAALTAALIPIHRVVFSMLVGPQFREASYLLPWMVATGGVFAAGQLCTLFLLNKKRSRALIAPRIATSLGGSGLYFLGARFWSLDGVVAAGLVSAASFLVWTILLVRRTNSEART